MKTKTLIGIVFLLLINNFIYAKIPQEHPSSYCKFPEHEKTRKKIVEWLSKAYDDAVNSILNGRNGRKLKQCKIDEINKILPNLIFEYTCSDGDGNCSQGGTEHDITKTPHILIFDPLSRWANNQKELDNPHKGCGCIEGMIVHEIIHAAGDTGREQGAVDCSKILYPCAPDPDKDETADHQNCDCCDKK